ncbi:MAG: helix-turn-helix domain-containing protein, partial [Gammaproteobacteria bacterium]
EIDSLCLHNATFRLVNYLLQQVPHDVHPHSQVHLDFPKGAIASRLAIQRETLSRILSKLREQGLIEVHGQNIILLNVKALRTIVNA